MSQPNPLFEDIIDEVANEYALCVKRARELFTEEQAIQSASATMFINASKGEPTLKSLVYNLRTKIDKIDREAIPSAMGVWKWHFREFLTEYPKMEEALEYYVSQAKDNEYIETHMKERYYRLKCNDIPECEREALEKRLFPQPEFKERPASQNDNADSDVSKEQSKGTQCGDSPSIHVSHTKKEFIRNVNNSPVFNDLDEGVAGLVEDDYDGYGIDDL